MNEHDESRIADRRGQDDPGHLLFDVPRRPHRLAAVGIAAAVVLTLGAGAGAWASVGAANSAQQSAAGGTQGGTGGQGFGGGQGSGNGQGGQGFGGGQGGQGFGGGRGFGGGGQGSGGGRGSGGSGSGTGTGAASGTPATDAQSVGVVTIDTELGYQSGAAAGTGIVLTSTGRILTNNHVIAGATAVKVTDETTDRSYTADVVGTDATQDVAVLQLRSATGLRVADLADDAAREGDDVTAVGNAGGTGTLSAASGSVTATGRSITTQSEGAADGESLKDLIETDADVISGDSGGPLQDSDGEVVGITTAATSGSDDPTGYAIPIATAVSVAQRIVAGEASDEITIGLPAFLGVSIDPDGDGAVVAQVLDGTAAASSDLAEGDTITAVDGTSVDSSDSLTKAIRTHRPGDSVRIAYTDASGASSTATVTLQKGPAD